MTGRYWCVRMGERRNGRKYANEAKNHNFIAIGWGLNDLSWLNEVNDDKQRLDMLKNKYREVYPTQLKETIDTNVGQIHRFVVEISIGDTVVMPARDRIYYIGKVTSDYYYIEKPTDGCPFRHRRSVEWRGEVGRDDLSEGLRSSLFAHRTVFSLDEHAEEIDRLLGINDSRILQQRKIQEHISTPVIGKDEVVKRLRERLLDLKPEFLQQRLVPDLLKCMDYEVSPNPTYKPDGGIDGRISLKKGLTTEDGVYQVKRTNKPIGAPLIRELRGVLDRGQVGVFITTSKFTKQAEEEARRSNESRIRLIDGEKLSNMILDYYDSLSEGVRKELKDNLGLAKEFVIAPKA